MDGTLVLHILLVIIFFLAVLACRMYCRKRNKHKALRFMIARIHPLRVTPVLHPPPHFGRARRTMSAHIEPSAPPELGEYLPGTNAPHSAEPSAPAEHVDEDENHEDQISLESHVIPSENNISTADDIKSPPPPYSAGDLPSYEEAIRWSKPKNDTEANNAS